MGKAPAPCRSEGSCPESFELEQHTRFLLKPRLLPAGEDSVESPRLGAGHLVQPENPNDASGLFLVVPVQFAC